MAHAATADLAKSLLCENASRILQVGQRYVEINALQDGGDAKRIDADADSAGDAVNVAVGRPTKEEEAN